MIQQSAAVLTEGVDCVVDNGAGGSESTGLWDQAFAEAFILILAFNRSLAQISPLLRIMGKSTVKPYREVALALPAGVPHLERVLHGIRIYAQRHADWVFIASPETHFMSVAGLEGWTGDGVIALVNSKEELRVAKSLKMPVVNLSGVLKDAGLPRVRVDYREGGSKAADHLLERGFQRFAFYGLKNVWYSQLYREGFEKRLSVFDLKCDAYEVPSTIGVKHPWKHGADELDDWLLKLPRPIGIMTAHDPRGAMVVQACRRVGLRVPHDVAVISANNDTNICEFCDPPLSSVDRNGEEIGFEAAAMLDRLMKGEKQEETELVLPPGNVFSRESTNILSVEEPLLEKAVEYINAHIAEPFDVDDLVRVVGRSRRWIEYAFQRYLRRSPHRYINEARVKRACSLLASEESYILKEVATLSGFSSTRQMNHAFQTVLGKMPRDLK